MKRARGAYSDWAISIERARMQERELERDEVLMDQYDRLIEDGWPYESDPDITEVLLTYGFHGGR